MQVLGFRTILVLIMPLLASLGAAAQSTGGAAAAGLVLVGKVVTQNDAGDVWPRGRVWLLDGRIQAMARDGEPLPEAASAATLVDTHGVIYPGLIDLHNHPEYAIYPLLPIGRAYRDRYEWRWYDDAYNKRITFPQEVLTRPHYLDLGLDIGRYGEYKALAGGTTSLQGGRINLAYSKEECLVRNVENSAVEPRKASSRVDIGRSAREWATMQNERAKGPIVIHLAEGPSPRMATEFNAIKDSALLGPELIAIHGVGLTPAQLQEMAAAGAHLVWSPLSNFLLYGKTADVAAAKRAGLSISLAPDWAPSGSKSALGELKVADLVNRHALRGLFSERELVDMVTRRPAQAMGWSQRLGTLAPGHLADVLVVDDRHPDPYHNLIWSTEEHIVLVAVRGEPLYGDAAMLARARTGIGAQEVVSALAQGRRPKAMVAQCPNAGLDRQTLAQTRARIQQALRFDAVDLAARLTPQQRNKDFAQCGLTVVDEAAPVTRAHAQRVLQCRFGLPFERTTLSPLTVAEDPDYLRRLLKNPNLPAYVRQLPRYYQSGTF